MGMWVDNSCYNLLSSNDNANHTFACQMWVIKYSKLIAYSFFNAGGRGAALFLLLFMQYRNCRLEPMISGSATKTVYSWHDLNV